MSCVVLNGQYSFCDFMLKVLSGYFFISAADFISQTEISNPTQTLVFPLEENSFCEFQKPFLPKCLS